MSDDTDDMTVEQLIAEVKRLRYRLRWSGLRLDAFMAVLFGIALVSGVALGLFVSGDRVEPIRLLKVTGLTIVYFFVIGNATEFVKWLWSKRK